MTLWMHVIATFVVLILSGLPVAGVVCGLECLAPAEVTEHCHDPAPSDTATINPVAPEGCSSIFAIVDIAARDRASAPISPMPLALPLLHLDQHAPDTAGSRVFDPHSRFVCPGLSAGTQLPLRI